MGSLEYFIWLGVCACIVTVMSFLCLKFKFSSKLAVGIMCIVSILSEVCKVFTHIEPVAGEGDWSQGGVIEPGALPLHLCSIFIFVFFFLYFNKNKKIEQYIVSFFVPIGLIGATLACILATSGVDFLAPYAYQCFVYHSFMIWLSLYYIYTKQVELNFKVFLRNCVILFSLAVIMIWVNGALKSYNTNFFFVVRPPVKNLPFLNLNDGWYHYFFRLVLCGFLGEFLITLPFIIKNKKTNN